MNKKVIIVESNKELIGRLKYYLNEYFNHTIDLLICEDLQECIKQIHSYDVVFINDLLGASSLVLYIDSHKLKVEVIVTSANPENYDVYKGMVSSFILSPYGYKEIVNAFNKAFNRFNDNNSDMIDPTKCFFNFDKYPQLQDAINALKAHLKEKFDVDYVGIDILDRNNEFFFWKNDHIRWHDFCGEYFMQRLNTKDLYEKKYLRMKSSKSNSHSKMSKWKNFDLRANFVGSRKNGFFLNVYDERCDIKLIFTITFKEANIDVDRLDKRVIESITEEINNSEYLIIVKRIFLSLITKHKSHFFPKVSSMLDTTLLMHNCRRAFLFSKHDKKVENRQFLVNNS